MLPICGCYYLKTSKKVFIEINKGIEYFGGFKYSYTVLNSGIYYCYKVLGVVCLFRV